MSVIQYIPDMDVAERYKSRTINGVVDLDLFAYAGEVRKNLVLFGPTGSAKTMAIEAYSATNDRPLVTVPCAEQVDVDELIGQWNPTGRPQEFEWTDGPVTTAARTGGILYLDEVNFLHPRIAAALHSLLDGRRVLFVQKRQEAIKAHPDFQVVAAYNPRYAGTRTLNEAFRNRFALGIEWGYVPEIEAELVEVFPSLLDIARSLREMEDDGEINTPTPTNALMEFEEFAIDLGLDFAITNFVNRYDDSDEQEALRSRFSMEYDRMSRELALFNAGDEDE